MTYNEMTKMVHENAVNHGWWDEENSFASISNLIHSELSEAVEEDRARRPFVYVLEIEDDMRARYETDMSKFAGRKPEGAGIELVDCVIRILDYAGHYKMDMDMLMAFKFADAHLNRQAVIADCHYYTACAYTAKLAGESENTVMGFLCECIEMIRDHITAEGYDFEQLINLKNEYNTGRPYKHGKAF